jgi:signal peptidase I
MPAEVGVVVDFSLLLVVATALAGFIWALDAAVLGRGRPPGAREPTAVEYARSFFPVLLLVLVVRSFLYEPFRIPSGSMMPTLLDGDFIFVNKYEYGLRLPVLNTKVLEVGEPSRGDVIVFRLPADPSVNYIKRLVGLPGDRVRYRDKRLWINDEPVAATLTGQYAGGCPIQPTAMLLEERLGGVSHAILNCADSEGREGDFVVPAGHYFMMGDNRDNSQDSRYIGFVPEGNVVGRAVRIWMNWDFPHMPQWSRIGGKVE